MAVAPRPMRPFFRNLALWLLILMILLLVFQLFPGSEPVRHVIPYTDFLEAVDQGRVAEVTLQGREVFGKYTDQTAFKTFAPEDPDLVRTLRQTGVSIHAKPERESPWYMTILISWFPMLLLIGVWIFFMRQMQAGGGKAMSFGKSRARLLTQDQQKVSFADVAGIDEAKEEVGEIVEFLRNPKKFTKLGGRIPKGVLLMGPPGTGKTLLAKAIAGEAGVPFFSISGSDFVEMFVGVGASRVRDLFIQGKKNAPCLIFIDEIDAVGRHRGAGLGGGHDEREQTLNQLLVEMDGFESNDGVILIAATNRPDVLDPALLRPGRFDRQVIIPRPDVKGREGILKVHTEEVPLTADVDLSVLARGTPGFSGADLENLVNEAALAAARAEKVAVAMEDFEKAKDKVLMGAERRSMVLSDEEKRLTAYHEAGHTVVAWMLPQADPIYKVSIIPRGRALGVTQQLPIDERHTYSRDYLVDRIAVFLGGRAAEEIFLGHLTTGAGDDIEKATEIARRMVCKWGMSERLGPMTFGKEEEQIFLGKEIATQKNYSEQTSQSIDEEIEALVRDNLERARKILLDARDRVEKLAETLLVKEVLVAEEIEAIVAPGSGKASARPEPVPGPTGVEQPAPEADRQPELKF
ncbi:MAG: ATP-dependent zinc metalloprotease FtsH [Deferrisomatales bacterium]|nr:ATP-dependent zinc metalloprotease FtsH [Deferrisomatales bacterium]